MGRMGGSTVGGGAPHVPGIAGVESHKHFIVLSAGIALLDWLFMRTVQCAMAHGLTLAWCLHEVAGG